MNRDGTGNLDWIKPNSIGNQVKATAGNNCIGSSEGILLRCFKCPQSSLATYSSQHIHTYVQILGHTQQSVLLVSLCSHSLLLHNVPRRSSSATILTVMLRSQPLFRKFCSQYFFTNDYQETQMKQVKHYFLVNHCNFPNTLVVVCFLGCDHLKWLS